MDNIGVSRARILDFFKTCGSTVRRGNTMSSSYWTILLVFLQIYKVQTTHLTLGLILPDNDKQYIYSIHRVQPAVELAIDKVTSPNGILGNRNITMSIISRDSKHSSIFSPLAAIEIYLNVDLFLGPVFGFGVAPIARYSPYWDVPVITAGALDKQLHDKNEFKQLTRVGANWVESFEILRQLNRQYGWKKFGMMYHKTDDGTSIGYQQTWAVYDMLQQEFPDQAYPYKWSFNEITEKIDPEKMLKEANKTVRCK